MIKLFAKMNPLHRAIARFLVMGGGGGGGEAYRKCQRHEPCRGSVSSPMKIANKLLLQVTTIKTTKSNENKSIHRLDLSGSTVSGGWGGNCSPAPSPTSYGSVSSGFPVYPHSFEISLHSIVVHFKRRHLQSTNYHR